MTTLDELLEMAHQQARRILLNKKDEELTPLWHLVCGDGEEKVIGTPFNAPPHDKDIVAAYMRHYMAENDVVMYSFLSEAWAVTLEKGDDPDRHQRPSEHPQRREMVLALACDREHVKTRSWTIKRDKRGRVTALPEEDIGDNVDQTKGIFAGLLGKSN